MCVRVEERGWTYNTQCLVETEATYTRFPGVMGKDRVIRMHSSSSRLNKRDIRAHMHTRGESYRFLGSRTRDRAYNKPSSNLSASVNKFVKSVLEQRGPTPRDSFVILSLPCARSCESMNVYRSEQEEKVLKTFRGN